MPQYLSRKPSPRGSFRRAFLWYAFLVACGAVAASRAGLIPFNVRIVGDLVGLAAVFLLMLWYWRKEPQASAIAERVSDPKAAAFIETIEGELRNGSDGPEKCA